MMDKKPQVKRRFRILWREVFAMLGVSALFVWFLLTLMEAWVG